MQDKEVLGALGAVSVQGKGRNMCYGAWCTVTHLNLSIAGYLIEKWVMYVCTFLVHFLFLGWALESDIDTCMYDVHTYIHTCTSCIKYTGRLGGWTGVGRNLVTRVLVPGYYLQLYPIFYFRIL